MTCIKLGFLYGQQSQLDEATTLIQTGLVCWDRSLELAPGNTALREQREQILAMLESNDSSEEE